MACHRPERLPEPSPRLVACLGAGAVLSIPSLREYLHVVALLLRTSKKNGCYVNSEVSSRLLVELP